MSNESSGDFDSTEKINAVRKQNTFEIILDQLKELIISGEFQPGQKLPGERILAKKFGASRNSLRLALKVLEFMHLVEIRHGLGVFIASSENIERAVLNLNWFEAMHQNPLMDLIEARKCFEPFMASLCAQRASESNIAELEKDLKLMEEGLEKKEHGREPATMFHETILSSSDNFILRQISLTLKNLMSESKKISLSKLEHSRQSLKEHREILDAIIERDPEKARTLMLKHLESVEEHLNKSGM